MIHYKQCLKNMFDLKSILGCKVEIPALRSSNPVPQCKTYQDCGLTQKYCIKNLDMLIHRDTCYQKLSQVCTLWSHNIHQTTKAVSKAPVHKPREL